MRKLIFLFICFLTIGGGAKAQITFKASAPEAVIMGQQFQLRYTVNGEGKDLQTPAISDFEVLMGPSSSRSHSTTIVNGKMTNETSTTYTYVLMPKAEGTFTIPAATVKVNNSNYTSNSVTVKVLPPDKVPENGGNTNANSTAITDRDVFVRTIVSKNSVYEQESLLVTYKLYFKKNPQFDGAKLPEFEGFLVQDIELPHQRQVTYENYNDINYATLIVKQSVLFPQKTGKLTLPSGYLDAIFDVPVQSSQRPRSFFDEFFDTQRVVQVSKKINIPAASVEVKTLPLGKPSSFSGGVGDFTMSAEINTNQVKANDAVVVKVKINGTGNVRLIKNPEVNFPNDFDIFDPTVSTDIRTTTAGTSGSKTIEYMAIPRFGGDFEIPPITFSYFDLKSESYKTITSEAFKLHVERGEGGENAPVVSNFSNRENVKYLGQDIRYIKLKGIRFISTHDLFFGSPFYILCYIIPSILFIVFFIVYRKQIRENSDLARVRTKKANKIAVKRLKNAGKLLKENKEEAFYEEILRASWGYLSDKLNIPQANLTKDNIETELSRYGVGEELIREFMDILNTCEFARYAPSQASDAMDKLYQSTVEAIGKMENTIRK